MHKTWFIDIDGVIAKHNGYLIDGSDSILPGVKDFFSKIPPEDQIILCTARKEDYKKITLGFLSFHQIRYTHILFNLNTGNRVLVNDNKPDGSIMAIAINTERDNPHVLSSLVDL